MDKRKPAEEIAREIVAFCTAQQNKRSSSAYNDKLMAQKTSTTMLH